MSYPSLTPKTDLAVVLTIKMVNEAGKLVPLTEASNPECFISLDTHAEATPAEGTLLGEVTYTGARGEWLVEVPSTVLTRTILDGLFSDATVIPYLYARFAEGVWKAVQLVYVPEAVI